MKKIFRNSLNGLALQGGEQLQLNNSRVTQLRMDRRALNGHWSVLAAVFFVARPTAKGCVVQLQQRTPLGPAWLPDTPVKELRNSRLSNTDRAG